jgi:hypothetical protein
MFGDRFRIAASARHVGDPDAAGSGCFQVDSFQSGPPLLDQEEMTGIHHPGIDPVHGRNDNVDPIQMLDQFTIGPNSQFITSLSREALPQEFGSCGEIRATKENPHGMTSGGVGRDGTKSKIPWTA